MPDYDLLRDYLKKQTLPEFVLSFEQIEEIIDAALPRAAHRASWWETQRSPQEKMPQREACLAGGYITRRDCRTGVASSFAERRRMYGSGFEVSPVRWL